MSSVMKLVINSLIHSKDERSICCLCLEQTRDEIFLVTDEITVETGQGAVHERIDTILLTLFNTQMFQYFNAVCKECLDSAVFSYKFIMKSKEQSKILTKAVDSLLECFQKQKKNDHKYQSLYALVKPDFKVELIYDVHEQRDPKETGLKRLELVLNKISEESNAHKMNRRERDYSTIFIKTHELIHDPSKPKEYKCKVCLKMYPNSGSLRQHFFAAHFKKDYQCPNCPKGFGTEGLLKTHIAQSHFTVNCDHCGKTLRNRINTLKRHAITHARELKVCSKCGRTYKKTTDYERHVAQQNCVHPSKQPGDFHCGQCVYRCRFKHQLAQHIKYEHTDAKAHICEWCDRRCYSQSALRTHILKHTKEKNFVCSECSGRFVTRQSLINHLRLHTGERPYKCEYCEQGFLSASRRKEHVERKHIDIIFECDLCDAKYNAKRSLTKHRKKHFESSEKEILPN